MVAGAVKKKIVPGDVIVYDDPYGLKQCWVSTVRPIPGGKDRPGHNVLNTDPMLVLGVIDSDLSQRYVTLLVLVASDGTIGWAIDRPEPPSAYRSLFR